MPTKKAADLTQRDIAARVTGTHVWTGRAVIGTLREVMHHQHLTSLVVDAPERVLEINPEADVELVPSGTAGETALTVPVETVVERGGLIGPDCRDGKHSACAGQLQRGDAQ